MSVRIVRTRNGEDIIADLFEVTTKEKPDEPVAFQLRYPYNVWLETSEPQLLSENDSGEVITKKSNPEIRFSLGSSIVKTTSLVKNKSRCEEYGGKGIISSSPLTS